MRSNMSAIRRPVRRSISASTSAGISPRMPPPSIASTFIRGRRLGNPLICGSPGSGTLARTMTHLPKKLLLIGTVACALGAAQPAAAQVQPAGTGEPLYTNSQQNTQWFEWPASSGIDKYRVRFDYYENNALVANPTQNPAPNGASNVWANWSGVRNLQHGGQYGVCAQGQYTFPNDSLWISDGPNSCSMGTQLGRRAYTTIDRSKPTTAIARRGRRRGDQRREAPDPGRLRRRRRRPVPGQLHVLPVRRHERTSATPTPASSTATRPRARSRAAAASRRRSPARPTSARATTRRPTARCGRA